VALLQSIKGGLFMQEKYTLEALQSAVERSFSYIDVLKCFGISPRGDMHRYIKRKIEKFDISVEHFCKPKKVVHSLKKKTASEILLDQTETKIIKEAYTLRRALLEIGRTYECEKCKIKEWQGAPITLQVHHIDGNSYNNKAENLMFICPNCHSQTKNYAGKGAKKPRKKCLKCRKTLYIGNSSGFCRHCYPSSDASEIILEKRAKLIITKEELQKIIWEIPSSQIAAMYGVSDKAIEKRCKKLGIEKPPRGYWAKKRNKGLSSE